MTDDKHADGDLGPPQPHKKPRKAAKAVLAGLVAAAGVAAGTAIVATNGCCAGEPVNRSITTQPATTKVSAKRQVLPGDMMAPVSLKSETRPVDR